MDANQDPGSNGILLPKSPPLATASGAASSAVAQPGLTVGPSGELSREPPAPAIAPAPAPAQGTDAAPTLACAAVEAPPPAPLPVSELRDEPLELAAARPGSPAAGPAEVTGVTGDGSERARAVSPESFFTAPRSVHAAEVASTAVAADPSASASPGCQVAPAASSLAAAPRRPSVPAPSLPSRKAPAATAPAQAPSGPSSCVAANSVAAGETSENAVTEGVSGASGPALATAARDLSLVAPDLAQTEAQAGSVSPRRDFAPNGVTGEPARPLSGPLVHENGVTPEKELDLGCKQAHSAESPEHAGGQGEPEACTTDNKGSELPQQEKAPTTPPATLPHSTQAPDGSTCNQRVHSGDTLQPAPLCESNGVAPSGAEESPDPPTASPRAASAPGSSSPPNLAERLPGKSPAQDGQSAVAAPTTGTVDATLATSPHPTQTGNPSEAQQAAAHVAAGPAPATAPAPAPAAGREPRVPREVLRLFPDSGFISDIPMSERGADLEPDVDGVDKDPSTSSVERDSHMQGIQTHTQMKQLLKTNATLICKLAALSKLQMSAQPSDLQRRLMSEAQQNLAAVMERVPPWAMLQTWRNQASKATTRDPLPQTPSPSPHPAVRVVNSARCLGLLPLHGEVPEEWAQCNPVQEPPSNLGRSQSTVATTPAVKPVDMQGMMDREDRESKKQRLQSAIVVDPPRLVPKLAKTPPQVFEGDARMTWMERAERPASWTGVNWHKLDRLDGLKFFKGVKIVDADDSGRLYTFRLEDAGHAACFRMSDLGADNNIRISYSNLYALYELPDGSKWAEHGYFYDKDDLIEHVQHENKNRSRDSQVNYKSLLPQDHTSRELLRLVGRFHSLLSEIEDECWIYEKREYNSLKSKKKLVRPKDTYFYRVTMDAVKMTLVSNGTQVDTTKTETSVDKGLGRVAVKGKKRKNRN